jgi:hypothetical protein
VPPGGVVYVPTSGAPPGYPAQGVPQANAPQWAPAPGQPAPAA